MFCPNCGAKNSDGAKFCKKCGTSFNTVNLKKNDSQGGNNNQSTPSNPSNMGQINNTNKNAVIIISIAAVCVVFICIAVTTFLIFKSQSEEDNDLMALSEESTKSNIVNTTTEKATEITTALVTEKPVEITTVQPESHATVNIPSVPPSAPPPPVNIPKPDNSYYISSYILPYSDSQYLSESDLYGLTSEQLRIARNEIYARHGRTFNDEGLQSYFNSCSWYYGTVSPENFNENILNKYEKANRDLIARYEKERGY